MRSMARVGATRRGRWEMGDGDGEGTRDEGFKFGRWVLGQTQNQKENKKGKILFASWIVCLCLIAILASVLSTRPPPLPPLAAAQPHFTSK